jgi:hypothetical protein
MKPKLLITRKVFPEVIEALSGVFEIDHNSNDDAWTPEELRRRASVCRALYVVASDRVDAALLEACPELVMIATGSVGYNHIDLDACTARGVLVTNTPDVLTEATADMAWTLLMAAARRMVAACGAILAGGRQGQMRLVDPLAQDADQFTIPDAWVLECRPMPMPADLQPLPRAVAVEWKPNWAPLSEIAASVTGADREALGKDKSGPARASSATITARVAQQRELTFRGLYFAQADALAVDNAALDERLAAARAAVVPLAELEIKKVRPAACVQRDTRGFVLL